MTKNVHAVGIIFENTAGENLILKRRGDSIEGGAWSLPGGKVDDGRRPMCRKQLTDEKPVDNIASAKQMPSVVVDGLKRCAIPGVCQFIERDHGVATLVYGPAHKAAADKTCAPSDNNRVHTDGPLHAGP